ncbi:MAG: hypothetical protein R3F61_25560 [Myxococcota bacterium]
MLWFLALFACDRTYDGPLPDAETAGVFGRVVGLLGGGVGDVDICAHDLDVPCVTSASDGDFLLEPLPFDADVIITMEKDGHLPTAYHHHTTLTQEWRKTLMSQGIVDLMTGRVDTEQEPGMGHALFILWEGPDYDAFDRVAGVSFDVHGASSGEQFYQADGGLPDADLTATSSSGSGGVFNLVPGRYELTFSGATCEPWFSHDFAPGGPVPVTILPDRASYFDLVCR